MQNILERIRQTLSQEYGFEVCDIHKMTTGQREMAGGRNLMGI